MATLRNSIKLFKVYDKHSSWWCFATNAKTAKKTIVNDIFGGNRTILKAEDVTASHINEDGVDNLISNHFVGVPQRSIFMLNGCMSSMHEHYDKKQRSGTLWWSEKIPGSKEIWK